MVMVSVSTVKIGERFRSDLGDLEPLAESIARQGMLQPIGINRDNSLVFGQRRLVACRDILGWTEIEARTVDVTSLVEGQHDENEMRKSFTPSERVAIAEAVRIEIGNRQGQRTDRELPGNCPEVKPGVETRTTAAKKAGFGSSKELARAKTVANTATPNIVAAMDKGEVSISAAAEVARSLPRDEQENLGAADIKRAAKKARAQRLTPSHTEELWRVWARASPMAKQVFAQRVRNINETTLDDAQLYALQNQWLAADDLVRKRFGKWLEAQFGLKLISLPPVKGRRPPIAPGSN